MNTQFDNGSFSYFDNLFFYLSFCFFDHFFNSCRVNPAIGYQAL